MNIGQTISKAIKEGKWLNISYRNKNNENTNYWIAINDIDFNSKSFDVSIFNSQKSLNTLEGKIYFNQILSASVIDFTSYPVPQRLIDKIEKNLEKCAWLSYDLFNHNILNYYLECSILDNDPSQKDYTCIAGIDLDQLRNNKELTLTDDQIKQIIRDIYYYDINKIGNSFYTLVINNLSIDQGKNKYIICYYTIHFNPKKKSLVLDNRLRFNESFFIQGRKHSLFNYINMSVDEFIKTFETNVENYQLLINSNLKAGETLNSRPEIMLLQREIPVDLRETFNVIEEKYNSNTLPVPLKSFFGNITKRNNIRKKEPSLIICDKLINVNQMRVLYNSIKYPVTYVQGPPGTGKTQTIINVVLSAFYNDKTMLICSSNNRPVNGIIEKLKFQYRDEIINFPYLRLGNFEDVKKATIKIRELFDYNFSQKPRPELLDRIKINSDEKNSKLIELLNKQEKRIDIENCLESSQKLIDSFKGNNSGVIQVIKNKIAELETELANYPEVQNEDIISLFEPLNENFYLSQYLFFKSLQYIQKLKMPRYSQLKQICNIEDDDDRAREFNKWTQDDINMKLLIEVFPVIFSTNISSRRLGTPNFMFNLVIMDESGQCNVATALLPITKAESLLLVGDQNQLKPVIILETLVNEELMKKYNVPEIFNYKTHSILDVMRENDNISKDILLKYHYRCGRKIINFSNQRYYNNSLNLSYIKNEGNLEVLDVKNKNIKQKNEAYEEAVSIVDYIERNNIKDAYIVTPFVNQKDLILELIKNRKLDNIECGTIHSLQGAEKDTIIFSPAISYKSSKKTFEWIKDNYELINVGVTRAKNKLVIASDTEVIEKLSDKKDDLYNLIQYAKNNGKTSVPPNDSVKIEIGNSNGSIAEDEFFKTISHFCSCHKVFEAERNVKISKLFKYDTELSHNNMEFDLVLYEKTFFSKKPIIAFEINGGEHLGVVSREQSDRKKMDICNKKGIKIIFIPNSFVKLYEYIADIIMSAQNKNATIQQSLFDE